MPRIGAYAAIFRPDELLLRLANVLKEAPNTCSSSCLFDNCSFNCVYSHLDVDAFMLSARRVCRYRSQGSYNRNRGPKDRHRDQKTATKHLGSRIAIHWSTQPKHLMFYVDNKQDTPPLHEYILGTNGFFIMDSKTRRDGLAPYLHMASCEGESVTITFTFHYDFTPEQCRVLSLPLRDYCQNLIFP